MRKNHEESAGFLGIYGKGTSINLQLCAAESINNIIVKFDLSNTGKFARGHS
jgi:hypothetical protein